MIQIIPFSDDTSHFIKILNEEWLNKYFSVEPNDLRQLGNPKVEIIDKGGVIFYAKQADQIIACAALMKSDEHSFELSKMAVTESMQGKGIGKMLMDHCLQWARAHKIQKLFLYSNTKLTQAISLYASYGFKEVSFDSTHYKRANIKMELELN